MVLEESVVCLPDAAMVMKAMNGIAFIVITLVIMSYQFNYMRLYSYLF